MREEVLCKGLSYKKNRNGFTISYLHYSADEEKDEEWAKEAKKSYPSLDLWNQEMELDFTKAVGRRVYPEFKQELHIYELKPIPNREIWRGWDFGYHHPACVWAQVDLEDRLCVLVELMGEEVVINKFAEQVIEISKKLFYGYDFKDAGDPAVRAKSDKSERTTADILRSYGIRIQTRPMLVRERINLLRNLLLPRPDGSPRFKIDKNCQILIDGFLGGYSRNEEDNPDKDGYYEHLMDALGYLVAVLYNPKTFERYRPAPIWVRPRPTAEAVTGY
jgi:hypothetical protein